MEDKLHHHRKEIDQLDEQIIELLAKRMTIVRAVGKLKKQHGVKPLDEKRWQQVIEARIKTAEKLQLPRHFIISLYNLIHEYALELEYTFCHADEDQHPYR